MGGCHSLRLSLIVMGFILITISASCSGGEEGSPPQAENFGDSGDDLGDLRPFGRGVTHRRRTIRGGRIRGGPQTLEDALVGTANNPLCWILRTAFLHFSSFGKTQANPQIFVEFIEDILIVIF